MKKLLTATALVSFALPVLADDEAREVSRLDQLETLVVTAVKEEPRETAENRLGQIEEIVITAEKAQPASHEVDEKTAELLAEIDAEE